MSEQVLPFPTHRGVKPDTFTELQVRIGRVIYTEHNGRANAMQRDHLAIQISRDFTSAPALTTRSLRKEIAEMVSLGLPIGAAISPPFGYFWIATEEERRDIRDSFLRMALSTIVHARAFDRDNIAAPLIEQLRAAGFGEEPREDIGEPAIGDRVAITLDLKDGEIGATGEIVAQYPPAGKAITFRIRRDGREHANDVLLPHQFTVIAKAKPPEDEP